MDLRSPVRPSSGATLPPPRGRRRARRLLVAGGLLASAAAAGLVGFAAVTSPSLGDPQAVVSERLSATGVRSVPLSGIAPVMQQAVVAAEDERFWGHHGIDTIGVARAVAYDASHLSLSQGASTITEQLAKQLYLEGNDRSPIRKIQDAILAFKLESVLSKDQILAAYLNTVYFGEGATGVGAASARYFGVPPSALTLAQASLLAGVIRSPTADESADRPAGRSRETGLGAARDGGCRRRHPGTGRARDTGSAPSGVGTDARIRVRHRRVALAGRICVARRLRRAPGDLGCRAGPRWASPLVDARRLGRDGDGPAGGGSSDPSGLSRSDDPPSPISVLVNAATTRTSHADAHPRPAVRYRER